MYMYIFYASRSATHRNSTASLNDPPHAFAALRFGTLEDAQSRLDLGVQQSWVHRPRALSGDCGVFGAVDEQYGGALGGDEQLWGDDVLGGGQARPVVEVDVVLEPEARELRAQVRRHAWRGKAVPEERGLGLRDRCQGPALAG